MDIWKPNVIVLGPGGAKGFLELGCMKRLYEEDYFLENVRYYTGVSVGAAIALLIVAGYTPDEAIDLCLSVNLIEDLGNIDFTKAKEKMGLIENKLVEEKLKDAIKEKFGIIPTLKQLYMITEIVYTAVTYNSDKMRVEYLDKDTEPDLSCVQAALMSMTIPFLIQPKKYKTYIYYDGAIADPYPVLYHDNGENNILGIYISSEQDCYSSNNNPKLVLYRLIQAGMKRLRDISIKYSSDNVKNIGLETTVKDTTGLSIDEESRKNMINAGYNCADEFLKINKNPEKYNISLDEYDEIPTIEESIGKLTHSVVSFLNTLNNDITKDMNHDINKNIDKENNTIEKDE